MTTGPKFGQRSKFQDGYTAREVARLDDFMQLVTPNAEIEMIGIGAAKRAACANTHQAGDNKTTPDLD